MARISTQDTKTNSVYHGSGGERAKFSERIRTWWNHCLLFQDASFVWRWAASLFGSDPKVESAATQASIRQPSRVVEKLALGERSLALNLALEILKEKGAESGFQELIQAMKGAVDYPFLADLGFAYWQTATLKTEKETIIQRLRTFALPIQDAIPGLLVSGNLQEALDNGTRVIEILGMKHIDSLYRKLRDRGVDEIKACQYIIQLSKILAKKYLNITLLHQEATEKAEYYTEYSKRLSPLGHAKPSPAEAI